MSQLEDLHIGRVRPLISPAVLSEEFPADDAVFEVVDKARRGVAAILDGEDSRLVVIVGPCSVHDPAAALDYAGQLALRTAHLQDKLLVIMRVYFEKPRTVVGWKGLINDPDIDNTYRINKGLRLARKLLIDIAHAGMPTATEFLDTTFGQYYADLISWGAIGARTAESQVHRELASGLSMPVGIKNRTDGDVKVAIDAIMAAGHRHLFPSLTKEGAPAIYETVGNRYAHLILRGGDRTGPNYHAGAVAAACALLEQHELSQRLIIDCSHGNSGKDPQRQSVVVDSVIEQLRAGQQAIRGVMLESHLNGGRQDWHPETAQYGVSITDACLALDDTIPLIEKLATIVDARRI
ncbi:MAG TPA: 3-deoxy-7-phosphoheptulonate synthase [Pseudomonadales bacterium]|nr:3-deoxy-7-phosphoheptulonate synthase [Pseudomonadales bacterium]